MAYVSNFTTQSSTTGATGYVLTLPPHVTDDIIVVGVSIDGGQTLSGTWGGNQTGGAQIGTTQTSGTSISTAMFYAKATGTAATLTINCGTADGIHVHMFILKDVDPTTQIDVSNIAIVAAPATGGANDFTFTSASVTTTTADCLVLYYFGIDQATTTPTSILSHPDSVHFLDSSDNGGTTVTTLASGACGWYQQRAIGATPTPKWEMSNTEITHRFVVAFRNKTSGYIPPYIDDSAALGTKITCGHFYVATTNRNNEYFPAALTYANIGPAGTGLATTNDNLAAVVDAGFNPYSSALNSTPAASTTNAVGFTLWFPTTLQDFSAGWIVGGFMSSTSKMANYTQGTIQQGGTYLAVGKRFNAIATTAASGDGATATITFATQTAAIPVGASVVVAGVTPAGYNGTFTVTASSTTTVSYANTTTGAQTVAGTVTANQYRSFNIMAQDNQDGNGTGFAVFSVKPSQTTTQYGYSAGNVVPLATCDTLFIGHKGQRATGAFYYTDIHLMHKVIVAGGTSTLPVDTQGLFDVGRYCRVPLLKKSGASAITAYVPVQIGGGDAVNFQIDAGSFQFPRIAAAANKEINYHGDAGAIGISYAGKSGDVIKHTNSIITSPSAYYWEIHSAATSAATWDFTGLTIVGANVTLRNVMTFANIVFNKCAPVTIGSCIVNNCEFTSHTGNNAITITASAESAAVDNCVFKSNTRAIKITAAGTYEFNGHLFSGNTYDVENSSAGAVIINNVNGSNASTFVNTGGGSTTINNVVNVTVKCVDESLANLQYIVVYIENASTKAQILSASTDINGIVTTTFNYTTDTAINIRIRKASPGSTKYIPIKTTGTITSAGFNLTATLYVDAIVAA